MTTAMEIGEVSAYVSDEKINTNEIVNNGNKKRGKKRQRSWMKEMVCNNVKEVEEAVINENQWSKLLQTAT
ncbi:unnamed protein product, partial [Didymodactylos carnosus]